MIHHGHVLNSCIMPLLSFPVPHTAFGFTYDNPALNAKALTSSTQCNLRQYNTLFEKWNLRQTVLKGNQELQAPRLGQPGLDLSAEQLIDTTVLVMTPTAFSCA